MRETSRRCPIHPTRRTGRMVLGTLPRWCDRSRCASKSAQTHETVRIDATIVSDLKKHVSSTHKLNRLAGEFVAVCVVGLISHNEARKMAAITFSSFSPDSQSVVLLYCSECQGNPIDAPAGVTPETRFICRACCARIERERNAERRRLAFLESSAGRHEANIARRLLARGKNHFADADTNHDFSMTE